MVVSDIVPDYLLWHGSLWYSSRLFTFGGMVSETTIPKA